MGIQVENRDQNSDDLKQFTQRLLKDLTALEYMLEHDLFETGIVRIGAEQEMCLVDEDWAPAPVAMEILEQIEDPRIVNEFARFNLEANLSPLEFKGDCFSKMESELVELLALVRETCSRFSSDIALVGILPTIRKRDLELENMTPLARYKTLNDNLKRMRGGKPFHFYINGTDELISEHPSSLLEACNTSFQVHIQVSPKDFITKYNMAQLFSAPVLAAASNSSLFFGKRLWHETRIALFQQSIDTRHVSYPVREQSPRVTFGSGWIEDSLLEIFRDDLARFRLLIYSGATEDSLQVLQEGGIPKLMALRMFNGTVYRWNRACYGITGDKPHLRIENRVLPSGPTPADEMANSAFWLGLMRSELPEFNHIAEMLSFDAAQTNFVRAAKMGLDSEFTWLNDRSVPARELILKELLPIARGGLEAAKVDKEDINRYLGIIEARVGLRRTGSLWLYESFNKCKQMGTRYEAAVAVTAGLVRRQVENVPVHEWDLADMKDAGLWRRKFWRVEQIMSTDLYTVREEDLVDLVLHIMDWKYIRHVPVEDDNGHLVGMVTARVLMKYLGKDDKDIKLTAVKEVMLGDLLTITPETLTLDALKIMRENNLSCLPVVVDQKLVGVLTEYDFTKITEDLLSQMGDQA